MPKYWTPEQQEDAHEEWLEYQAIYEYETSGRAWADRFKRYTAEGLPAQTWGESPGLDRRWFAVDGDIEEQERRDAEAPVVAPPIPGAPP